MSVPLNEAVVMVIEDEPLNAILATKLLQITGVEQIIICRSGAEARQRIPEIPRIDLILLDLRLPDEDGFMILKTLRDLEPLKDAMIVAATANVMPDDVRAAQTAGFDGFLGKPFNFDRFSSQIARFLEGEHVWEPR